MTALIIHYFSVFVKIKAGYEQDLEQDLQDMSRIYKISRIFRIRKAGLKVRRTLMSIDAQLSHGAKVRRTLIYRRARACPSPASFSQKASRRGRALLLPCIPLLYRAGSPEPDMFANVWHLCQTFGRSRTTGAVPLCRAGSPDPARTATKNPVNLGYLENPAAGDRPPRDGRHQKTRFREPYSTKFHS